MNREEYKDYVDKFSEMIDMLVLRHELLRGKRPHSGIRLKFRNEVMGHLAERFPIETKQHRDYLLWLNSVTGSNFRNIPTTEVPDELQGGCFIYHSIKGHLSAKSRYRNGGLNAYKTFSLEKAKAEEERRLKVMAAADEGAFEDELTFETHLLASPFLNPQGDKVRERADAIRRFNMALDRCAAQGLIFPIDEVTGFLLGIEPNAIAHWRYNVREYHYEKVGDEMAVEGWYVRQTPQKSLLERVTEKLKGLDEAELESLRQLLMADE